MFYSSGGYNCNEKNSWNCFILAMNSNDLLSKYAHKVSELWTRQVPVCFLKPSPLLSCCKIINNLFLTFVSDDHFWIHFDRVFSNLAVIKYFVLKYFLLGLDCFLLALLFLLMF